MNDRFVMITAPSILELVNLCNEQVEVLAQCIYFGRNGDVKLRGAKYVAVFDVAPVLVQNNDESVNFDEIRKDSIKFALENMDMNTSNSA